MCNASIIFFHLCKCNASIIFLNKMYKLRPPSVWARSSLRYVTSIDPIVKLHFGRVGNKTGGRSAVSIVLIFCNPFLTYQVSSWHHCLTTSATFLISIAIISERRFRKFQTCYLMLFLSISGLNNIEIRKISKNTLEKNLNLMISRNTNVRSLMQFNYLHLIQSFNSRINLDI